MKAAVVSERGGIPAYADFPDPIPGEGKVLIAVEAVSVENVDRAIVDGSHYTSQAFQAALPGIPCFDGIGRLHDGTLVGFGGAEPPYGTLAEWAIVPEAYASPVPEGIAPEIAATMATAIGAMCMRTAGGLKAGESVMIQGATGVAGRLAMQVARLLGAGRIIATGRDDAALQSLVELGADAVIDTRLDDESLIAAYRATAADGLDVVVDYLWGRPTELLARALVPDSFSFRPPVRLVQIGAAAGPALQLDAESLRTSGLEIYGAAKGMAEGMADAYAQVVEWTRNGDLTFDITVARLSDIESAWQRTDLRGSRLVVMPDRVIDEKDIGMSRIEAVGRDLHELMHRIPGVPEHESTARSPRPQPHGRLAHADTAHLTGAHPHSRAPYTVAHHDPARRRVLPSVQAWIEQLVTRD